MQDLVVSLPELSCESLLMLRSEHMLLRVIYRTDVGRLQILESARELKEIGAAVGIGGGAGKILRRFGICIDQEGGMVPNKIAIWTMDGNKLAEHPPPPPTETGEPLVSSS
jgi:2-polyprenyl-6-methoxyphenol hydroxylase-like FAD-dependent oxidoreductase